jgi:hypothetical protein
MAISFAMAAPPSAYSIERLAKQLRQCATLRRLLAEKSINSSATVTMIAKIT